MTVSADAAKAGPYTGNGSASSFAFDFKVFADTDIRVVETLISTAVETDLVLNTHYTVTRNVDQDNNPGGSITYKVGGVTAALPATKKLTIVGNFTYEQPTDIPNGGAFFAQIVENALDRVTLLAKQLKERLDRAATVPVSSSYTPDQFSDDLITLAAIEADISTVAAVDAEVVTVAGIAPDVSTVAGVATAVVTVAGIATDVSATAAVDADIVTCAANIAAIQAAPTQAADAAASASAAASSQSAAAASAAAAAATLASALWRDVVFVTPANSPVTLAQADNGKLYVADTTSGPIVFSLPQISGIALPYTVGVKLEAGGNGITVSRSGTDTIDGATSKNIASVGAGAQFLADTDPAPDKWTAVDFGQSTGNHTDEVKTAGVDFTAGTSTALTLANDYGSETNIAVHFDTAFQGPDTYNLVGTTLTFTSVIPLGVSKVYIKGGVAAAIGVPGDSTVSTAKIVDGGVTAAKMADTAIPDKIHAASSKTTPIDADELALVDSAASNALKNMTWGNLKAAIKAYFDSLYVGLTGNQTIAGVKTFSSQPIFPSQSMVRLNTANGYGSTNTKIRRFTNTVTNRGTDISYTDSATLGASFTINTAGVYAICFTDQYNAAGDMGLSLNTTTPTTAIQLCAAVQILAWTSTAVTGYGGCVSWTGFLSEGDVIRAHCGGTASGAVTNGCQFTITRTS